MAAVATWFQRLFRGRSQPAGALPRDAAPVFVPGAGWMEGQLVFDDFEVLRVLGEGALGAVYLLQHRDGGMRFAVKRIRFPDAVSQKKFLEDLQAWLYLPEYPHFNACRFYRALGDEVSLFIEYADGRTVADQIAKGRLYADDPEQALERVLDIAIQFAWGLHALHELKVIHQNAQPGNVFVSGNGTVKLSDIGLSRAATNGFACGGNSTVLRSGGIAAAYCSPEQCEGRMLTPAADIWSWGAAVLEMFAGAADWPDGPAQFLEAYLLPDRPETESEAAAGAADSAQKKPAAKRVKRLAMPPEIAAVLRKCFAPEPAARWQSMIEAADTLRQAYQKLLQRPYARRVPASVHHGTLLSIAHARWSPAGGAQWTEPLEWRAKALRALGRTMPALKGGAASVRVGSRKSKALSDLPEYEEVKRLFDELAAAKRRETYFDRAIFYAEKAFVHISLNDSTAALTHFSAAIAILEELMKENAHPELANDLAMAYLNHAMALKQAGEFPPALKCFEQAIQTWDTLVNIERRRELSANLAWAKALRADALFHLADRSRVHAESLRLKSNQAHTDADDPPAPPPNTPPEDMRKLIAQHKQRAQEMQKQAQETASDARDKMKRAQDDARAALSLFRTEVARTDREDIKAIQSWAIKNFEGML